MSDRRRQVETFCTQAGMEEDSPLRLALVTVMETAETAAEAVKGGARGLTPEGEADLIRRVALAVTAATEREAARIVRRSSFTTAAVLMAAGLAFACSSSLAAVLLVLSLGFDEAVTITQPERLRRGG